jgi:Domain of unknown function (DUF1906)
MPVVEGVDFSWSRPSPTCLHDKGIRWAGRYVLSTDPGKTLTKPEAERLAAAGLSIVSIHQPSGDKGWMLGGYARGVSAAKDAVKVATACGMPDDRPITYALDIDPNPLTAAQWDMVRQTLRGCASVHGVERTGIYGGWKTIDVLMPTYAKWGYQTVAWSGGRWHPDAQIHQYRNNMALCGGQIDYTRGMRTDYGQWRPGWSPGGEEWWERPLTVTELQQIQQAFTDALR